MPLIRPDILYGSGVKPEQSLPLVGARGPRGRDGEAGPRGAEGPIELGGSTAGTFTSGSEHYFGPDGTVYAAANDVVPGRLIGKKRSEKLLTVKCNLVPTGCQLMLTVYQSTDSGASWQAVGNAVVAEGMRTTTATVNVTMEEKSLHCASVAVDGFDYTGPVSWLLHN